MTFYDDMQNVASDVLKDFKQGTIKYIEVVPGSGDADDPGAATENVFTLDGAARGVASKYVDNSLILATDLQVTASVKAVNSSNVVVDLTPENNGFIEIDAIRHKIVKIMKKPEAGTTVAIVFVVRK